MGALIPEEESMSNEARQVTQPKMSRNILTAFLLIGIPVIAILVYIALSPERTNTTNTGVAIVEGTPFDGSTAVEPPRDLRDFTLTAHTGEPMSLSDLQGQPALLFFGYTHCPDFCPTTLLAYQRIRELLGEQADAANFLFISVDPARDTQQIVASYLRARGVAEFVTGMVGEDAVLQQISADYGLTYGIQPGMELESDYLVDHTVLLYLVDGAGQLVTFYSYGTEPEVIAEDIQKLLGQ
jgi:protein SCO1